MRTFLRWLLPIATFFGVVELLAWILTQETIETSGTVLVVDDDPGVRCVAAAILNRAGMSVATAADGDEGVTLFRESAGSIDLVILDLTMPRLGGFETFEQIRAIDADVPIVLMSGYTEQEASARFVGRGLAGFLQKPFTSHELGTALRLVRRRPGSG
jgi:DNA-binding response OmpR family regulator